MSLIRKSGMAPPKSAFNIAWILVLTALTFLCAGTTAAQTPWDARSEAPLRLAGHVLPALTQAAMVTAKAADSLSPLTLTIVLKRDDEAGFQQYLHDVYDLASPTFRHFFSQTQIAERFGPSQEAYDQVSAYLGTQNFVLVQGSANRMTLTVAGARADVERAFALHIGDYTLGKRIFYANNDAPVLPAAIGFHVNAVLGLSDLAQLTRIGSFSQGEPPAADDDPNLAFTCKLVALIDPVDTGVTIGTGATGVGGATGGLVSFTATVLHYQCAADELNLVAAYAGNAGGRSSSSTGNQTSPPATAASPPGTGQKTGLVEFDSYHLSDVLGFLNLIGHPERLTQISDVTLGAGADFTVEGESEVLLDIDTLLSLAPGANVAVYDAGFRGQGSFQTMFNAMIGGGVSVISNSWAYCENQTTLADVQSLDSILQSAAASGITVLTGAGDSGSTCLDGSPNTVAVPAGAATITAVGGTTALPGLEGTYGSETWWDGTLRTPATGQGGFGLSRFFNRPVYQNGLNTQAMRSVPDVTAPADPAQGVLICQAAIGGCPANLLYGGTSIAAPIWAAFVAVLNQRMGSQLGFLNPQLYPLANGSGFHSATSMGSDFAHVGLGSPNAGELQRLLSGAAVGPVNVANSAVVAFPTTVYADNLSVAGVAVVLLDGSFNTVSGQNVTLTANAGSSAVITAVNSTSNVSNGAARFTIKDTVDETITLTAATTAGTFLHTAQVTFVGPPATAGGIVASPTTQTADGTSRSTVTVTLQDAQGHAAPNKQVRLAQNGNSVILGANPGATAGNGQVQFDVTDQVQETAVYTAIDVSDGNLPVPGSANVTFSGAVANSCGNGSTPVAGPGYAISVYASGFPVQNGILFGGINLSGCAGVTGIAFDSAGNLFASDYVTGDVYKFPPGGGIAGAGNRITGTPIGPSLGGLAFGADGTLYATRVATSDTATTGAVLKIDKTTGAAAVVAPNIPCPANIATDPLSGDLFVSDFCFGSGQESASIWRIASPSSGSPVTTVYATSSFSPNGSLSFAPDGTLYAVYGYPFFGGLFAGIDRISGTNGPATPSVQSIGASSSYAVLALGSNATAGGAQSLIVGALNTGGFAHSLAVVDVTVSPPVFSGTTLVEADIGSAKIVGTDNCVYLANGNVVYKLANADGSCPLNGLAPNPSIVLSPETVPATAAQGDSLRFDVSFSHTPVLPLGTPINFVVSGANSFLGTTSVGFGNVTFTYSGRESGSDTIVAFAQLNGTTVTSNAVPVIWTPGKHATFIDLNNSASGGTIGSSTVVTATLVDESATPPAPIAGATIQFTLAGQSCSATTDANGKATCSIAVSALTQCTLAAAYTGNSQYLPATASELFAVSNYEVIFTSGFESSQPAGCVLYN